MFRTIGTLNLSDETGRQKLLTLLRKFLVETDIPPSNMNIIITLMKQLSSSAEDFFRMITEANCAILDSTPPEDVLTHH